MQNFEAILICCEKIEKLRQKIKNLHNSDYEDVMQTATEIVKLQSELEFEVMVLQAVVKLNNCST